MMKTIRSSLRRGAVTGLVILSFVVVGAVPTAQAGVKVDYEDGIDFGSYRTYAWKPGTDAARPEVQRWIVNAVERQLSAHGLRKTSRGEPDVYVTSHAFARFDAEAIGNYQVFHNFDVGVITHDAVLTTKGTLVVDLVDGASKRPVWRGLASEVMGNPNAEQIRKKIDKVTKKMFRGFPPR